MTLQHFLRSFSLGSVWKRDADLGQSRATKYRNLHFRLFTHVHSWSKNNEFQELKADVYIFREPIEQRAKEPKIHLLWLLCAFFSERLVLTPDILIRRSL
jgi:hypothetical protein